MGRDRRVAGAGHRLVRLEGLLCEELDALVRDELADRALDGVRVIGVVLSKDYRRARVHCVVRADSGTTDERACVAALERARGVLRRRMSESIELKRTPELHFVVDAVAPEGVAAEEGETCEW